MESTKLTPGEVARLWRIGIHKVLRWIHSGELRAVNMAACPTERPRFLIDEADLQAFEESRANVSRSEAISAAK